MTITGIDHVQIAAPSGCEEKARAFYGVLLGLAELPKPGPLAARGGCWFAAGTMQLHVGVEEPFAPARKAHPGFVVDGLEELRRRLEEAGVPVVDDTSLPGVSRFYAEDAFGNRLEFRSADV
jgi:catechol 2,3-dioxygenase-like lactoylglutathione lyase family enzyme